jgi:hypothetical protein
LTGCGLAGGFFFSDDIVASLGLVDIFGSSELVSLGNSPILSVSHVKEEAHTGAYFKVDPE